MLFSKEKITSFTGLTLRISSMRSIEEYEIICRGEQSEVAHYTRIYTGGEDDRRLNRSTEQPTEALIELFNECSLLRWDGFHGPNPRGVRDGYMFLLEAQVNDGRTIRAEGSNNYPRHYREFTDALRRMLYE